MTCFNELTIKYSFRQGNKVSVNVQSESTVCVPFSAI